MGTYFQTHIHKVTLDTANPNQLPLIDDIPPAMIVSKQVIGYEWANFDDCSAYLCPEHNSIYQWLTVNSCPEEPVKVATVCNYDADTKESVFSYEIVKKEGIRAYIPKTDREFILKGYLVCESTKQFINLQKVSKAALESKEKGKILISPLALLTRLSNTKQGNGDMDFTKIGLETIWLVSAWYNQLIYYIKEKPNNIAQDITSDILCNF